MHALLFCLDTITYKLQWMECHCMAAAFGSGAMFSLVSGFGGPNQAANAVTSGLFFALVQGGLFQIGQKFSQPPAEDTRYIKARNMLHNLGLEGYEKNFKKGLLTDNTLPLLTDSALRDVRIPPGPRLLILDHIERDLELKRGKRGGRN
ncbi:putative sterile alpha motif/pointed domain-containing protein [Lupinus albus]|uniref:Putative sterile alpha motif/pointed domain-containing protein n=1 Tax=Lupinus albus TaxID=3870 RepID=A0A6A4Q4M1_LUPAL|nr:putative sterile alpha motif/pointed domain-containing protein [Lupinus albus]